MLYIAIPAHNEVDTIGVLLWRLRSVLAEFPREYEVVVFDDASADGTPELLESYRKVLPLTVLRSERQQGYARAIDQLLRHVAGLTRHPRRDAVLLLQGDFTDPPELIPEFARRFEGGADIVAADRTVLADAPAPVHRLFRMAGWSMRSLVRPSPVRDVTSTLRLVRIAVVRDLMRERGESSLAEGDTWTANADLLLRLVPFARRIETVPVQSTYGVRMRNTRRVAMRDGIAALKWAWAARRRGVRASETADSARARDDAHLTLTRTEDDERAARPRTSGAAAVRGDRPERGDNRHGEGRSERPRSERRTRSDARDEARDARPTDREGSRERGGRRSREDREGREGRDRPDTRPSRPERTPRGERPAGTGELRLESRGDERGGDERVGDERAERDAAAEERRRKRRKRGKRGASARMDDSHSLELVDPAAGPRPEADDADRAFVDDDAAAGPQPDDVAEGGAAGEAPSLDERRRKRRRRRKRSRENGALLEGERDTEGGRAHGDPGESAESDSADRVDMDRNHGDSGNADSDDRGADDAGSDDTGSDDTASDDSGDARPRRRGRRGRRGGRRTRRAGEVRGENGEAADSADRDQSADTGRSPDADPSPYRPEPPSGESA